MTSKLSTTYTVTWSNLTYTITWSSLYSPVSFGSSNSILSGLDTTNYYFFGQPDAITMLDWTKETSLGATSLSDLLSKIAAQNLGITSDMLAGSIPDSKLLQLTTANKVADSANTSLSNATSNNTPSTLMKRDVSGGFSAVNASLTGNLQVNTGTHSLDIFPTGVHHIYHNFTNPSADRQLSWPDPGTDANVLLSQGAQTINGATTFANTTAASSTTTGAVIVSGGLGVAKQIYGDSLNIATSVSLPSSSVTNNMLAGSITDDKLSQLTTSNKVADSANTSLTNATSSNNASTLMKRDVSGSFAGNIATLASVSFTGGITGATNFGVYGETTSTATFTWGTDSTSAANLTINYTRIGRLVIVQVPPLTYATNNTSTITSTANTVPSNYRPGTTITQYGYLNLGGGQGSVQFEMSSAGTITIKSATGSTLSSPTGLSTHPFFFVYHYNI